MPRDRVAEILEAVALVLRDLKVEFEKQVELVSETYFAREKVLMERLAVVSEAMASVRTETVADRSKTNDLIADISHRVRMITDCLEKDEPVDLEPIHGALTTLQEKHQATDTRVDEALGETQKAKIELSRLGEVLDAFRIGQEARDAEKEVMLEAADASKAALAHDLSEIVERLQDVEKKTASTDEIIEKFYDQHAKAQATLAGLAEGLVEASHGKESLSAKIDSLDQALVRLTQAVGKADEKVDSLDGRFLAQDAEWDRVAKVVTEYLSRIASLETAIEAAEERDVDAQGREAALADQLASISELQDRQTKEFRQELRDAIDARAQASDQMLVKQAQQFISKLAENIQGERGPAGYLSRVQRWVVDYEFPEQALVLHHAGLWQALRATDQEPHVGEGSDWLLIAPGIESAHAATDPDKPGEHILSLRDSAGHEHTLEIQIPLPRFFKTWEKERTYQHYDSVVEDGHRWLSIVNNPTGPPSRSEDWILLGMRGARGARGAKGDRGLPGLSPNLDDIVEAYARKMEDGPGIPIFRYRGGWRYGADYARGDLVQGNRALILCIEGHRAEKNPSAPGQQPWMVLFSANEGPENESPGNLGHRLEAHEREIASLKQQIEDLST